MLHRIWYKVYDSNTVVLLDESFEYRLEKVFLAALLAVDVKVGLVMLDPIILIK